jgi:phage terminase small subunit
MKTVKNSPPTSINTLEKHEMYRVLHDDIDSSGKKLEWVDRHALGDLACMIVERNALIEIIEDKGESYKTQGDRNIVEKKNPARTALEKIRPQIFAMMREFKMTPASRKSEFGGGPVNPSDSGVGDKFDEI